MSDDPTRQIDTPATNIGEPAADAPSPAPAAAAPAAAHMPAPVPITTEPVGAPEVTPGGTEPPSPLAPPATVTAPPSGSNRMRWVIGLGVAGLAIVVAIGAIIVLGSRPAPEALKYIPADAAFVAEVRMDLPGDQMQKLGNLLAHFPGFLDQSTMPDKIDEALSRLVGSASGGSVDYRGDIKPWLSGPAFAAFRPSADASADNPMSFARGVVSLTTTGTVSCNAPFEGRTVSHETYRGLDLFIGNDDSACVIDGHQALIGDAQSVRDALDAHADGKGLDRSEAFRAARSALQGDQLATFYISGASYSDLFTSMVATTPGMSGFMSTLTPAFPEWVIQGVRAEDDAVVVDVISGAALKPTPGVTSGATSAATAGPSLLAVPPAHPSVIAPMAPANTVVFVESQGTGVDLQNLFTQLQAIPDLAPALQMLNGAGGAAQLVGWIEDAGVIVVNGPDAPTGGVLLVAADEAAAKERVATLTSLIALVGIGGSGIETRESTIAGVMVTTVTISNLGSFVPPGSLPPGTEVPADAEVEFSIAAKGRVILLGTGESFMTAVLNVQPGASLADQAFYKKATARALANSRTSIYVGIRDIVAMVEKVLPADEKARWDSDVRPYVTPFEALSMTTAIGEGAAGRSRLVITVSQP